LKTRPDLPAANPDYSGWVEVAQVVGGSSQTAIVEFTSCRGLKAGQATEDDQEGRLLDATLQFMNNPG
jgi:hypothetical protein